MKTTLRLGTRGSALAMWQANWVVARLREFDHDLEIEVVKITTKGDARQDIPLPEMAGKGVFVREIESALLRDEIDIAVHSAKDLTSVDTPGLTLAAFCEREDARDALVAPRYGSLASLPIGATVATGSPRRIAQFRRARPDLRFVEIRGNVDTRLAKLADGAADALVLAAAGLVRLGRADAISERLPIPEFLPQVGQASVAVQVRSGDVKSADLVFAACNDAQTQFAVNAERSFLARLGGGCTAPVAAHATVQGDLLSMSVFVASQDNIHTWTASAMRAKSEGTQLAEQLFTKVIGLGAARALEARP